MVHCQIFGDTADVEIEIDFDVLPQIGSQLVLNDYSEEVILSGIVKEVTHQYMICGDGE